MNRSAPEATAPPAGKQAAAGVKILILEDVPTDAELMQRALRHDGMTFTAKRVDTEQDFTAALVEFSPDIVLADFKLPTYDGLSAVTYVRREYPGLPVIVVTGALRDETAIELMKAGAVDYVLKDRLARLPAAVRSALAAVTRTEALHAAEESLLAIAAHSQDAVLVMDEKTTIKFWNQAAEKYFGYSAAEATGRSFRSFLALEAEAGWLDQEIAESLPSEEPHRAGRTRRLQIKKKDGTTAAFDFSVSLAQLNGARTVTVFGRPPAN